MSSLSVRLALRRISSFFSTRIPRKRLSSFFLRGLTLMRVSPIPSVPLKLLVSMPLDCPDHLPKVRIARQKDAAIGLPREGGSLGLRPRLVKLESANFA